MWNVPAPTDPIANAFRLYRDYDGNGGRFGETSLQASSTDQTQLAIYGAERAADGALTLIVLNKTTAAIAATFSLANYTPSGGATVYSYTASNLTKIVSAGNVAITANALSYSFPAYSATVLVIGGSAGAEVDAILWPR
jgi:O-glycosyl hydrolase